MCVFIEEELSFCRQWILIINGSFREYLINPLQYGFIMLRLEDHNLLWLRFFFSRLS